MVIAQAVDTSVYTCYTYERPRSATPSTTFRTLAGALTAYMLRREWRTGEKGESKGSVDSNPAYAEHAIMAALHCHCIPVSKTRPACPEERLHVAALVPCAPLQTGRLWEGACVCCRRVLHTSGSFHLRVLLIRLFVAEQTHSTSHRNGHSSRSFVGATQLGARGEEGGQRMSPEPTV